MGKITDTLTGLGLLRVLVTELHTLNEIGRALVDEVCIGNGRLPRYAKPVEVVMVAGKPFVSAIIDDQLYATNEFLKDFARLQGIAVDDLTDIQALAYDRGWIDDNGKVLVGNP